MEKLNITRFGNVGFYQREDDFLTLSVCVADGEKLNLAILNVFDLSPNLKVYCSDSHEFLYENNKISLDDGMEVIAKVGEDSILFRLGPEKLIMQNKQLEVFTDYITKTIEAKIVEAKGGQTSNRGLSVAVKADANHDIVHFIGKDYRIPKDLVYYTEIFAYFDEMKNDLINKAMKKIASVGYLIYQSEDEGPGKIDMFGLRYHSEFTCNFDYYTDEVIKMLCNKKIYNKSKDEYLNSNDGYKYFNELEQKCWDYYLNNICKAFSDEVDYGKQVAYNNAASTITGTGIRVFSSSFATLAAHSAIEYSALKGQAKRADEQYSKDYDKMVNSARTRADQRVIQFAKETYVPNLKSALSAFAFSLMDNFVTDLIKNGIFNKDTFSHIDFKKSQDLLKNLSLSSNKEEILENAFLTCPFNDSVYEKASDLDLCDVDTLKTSIKYCPDNKAVNKIIDRCTVTNKHIDYRKENERIKPFLPIIALQMKKSESEALLALFVKQFNHYDVTVKHRHTLSNRF